MKKIYAILIVVLFLSSAGRAQVYVDANATGINNGSSWANAFTDLQSGINAAAGLGGQVWVAAGTYTPAFDDPNMSFSMKDLVEIYGGFTGTETTLGQRDFRANVTILSGNLNGATSYHVFNNSGISSTAILDGFTITGGRASAGNLMGNSGGGGMLNTNADPIIRNCRFTDNKTDMSVSVANGGAIYNDSSEPIFINCIFDNNEAKREGGAIYGLAVITWHRTKMYNCIFRDNVAGFRGGAVGSYVTENMFVNCTIYGNTTTFGDGALARSAFASYSVRNSIVWGNSAPAIPAAYAQVSNSIVEQGYAGTNVLASDPLFTNAAQNDFSLKHCSPAVNSGSNSQLVAEITSDFDGNTRTIDGTVDMGAFEYQNAGIAPISITATGNNISCYGLNEGVISLTYSGGVAPLEVFLDNNSYGTTTSITGLSASVYEVKVVDAEGCEEIDYITITEPAELFVTTLSQDIVCNGDGSGSITITATGGTPPLQYSIDETNFGSSGNFNNLSSGNYTITVKEANDCTYTEQISISEPAAFSSGIQVQSITCNGNADGIVSFSPTGGTSPYVYSKDGISFGGGSTFSLLTAGNHTFTILDAVSCLYTVDFTIVEPDALSSSVQTTPTVCNGEANGTATITPIGGTAPYTFSLDGINFQSTTVTLSQLPPDTYPLTLIDANGCMANSSVIITEAAVLSLTYEANEVLCNGAASGVITVTGVGGTPPYAYSTDGTNFQPSNVLSGLAAGGYDVIIRDAGGCMAISSPMATISEPSVLSLTASLDGAGVTLAAAGGTSPYSYSVDGSTFQTSNAFVLGNGQYTFTVKDDNDCEATTTESLLITALGDKLGKEQIAIFPNPASSELYLKGLQSAKEVYIVDQSGRIVYNQLLNSVEARLSIANLNNGVYLLFVINKNGRINRFKLMKK